MTSNTEGQSKSNHEDIDDSTWTILESLGDGYVVDEIDEERDRQIDRYVDYLRGNIELSKEEADKMHVLDEDIMKDLAFVDCCPKLEYLIAQKVNKFIWKVHDNGYVGENEQDVSLSEQHEKAEQLLGISPDDFDGAFEARTIAYNDSEDNGPDVSESIYDTRRQIFLAFMRGDLQLTKQQADMLYRTQGFAIKNDDLLSPYRAAIRAMDRIKNPWLQESQKKAEKKMTLFEQVFLADDESIQEGVRPFMEAVSEDKEQLIELTASIDFEKTTTKQIQKLVDFLAVKFGIGDDIPQVRITLHLDRDCLGLYYERENRIEISMGHKTSIAELVSTIAHETWHAHQYHNRENEAYEYNNSHYVDFKMNWDLFKKQLIEREAFEVGEQVSNLIRKNYLASHPEEIPRMAKAYKKKGFQPDFGLDEGYYKMAYEMHNKPQPHRGFRPKTSFFGGLMGFHNKKKS